ncbi:hypothetical protein B0H10DRAFT_1847928 [Mycena sp. CBHHK59/15]|nr:hypothetical protein B0H10DRAFT_1847928 [Mycena sp. CBHHK59/15]
MRTAPVCLTTFPGLSSWTDAHVKAPENLREIPQQFATDAKTLQERCDILRMQYSYSIKKTTLKNLNREHGIVSAHRPLPEHICTTLIAKQMAENVTGTNGPNTIQKRIALKMVFLLLGKAKVRRTMHALNPGGPARRFPSKRPPKVRSTLTDTAVYYEIHLDGYEILNFKALRMGRASVDMYGGQCHGSGYIVHMTVVPNARCAFTVGHLYLDLVESRGGIYFGMPMFNCALVLDNTLIVLCRAQFLPDVSSTEAPACVALKSSDNIPIEALWSYFLKYTGHDLKAAILLGKTENYINVSNELHIHLFHWLWSRTVQNAVNQFVRYWNTHKTRKQSSKYLPWGVAPEEVFQHPENFGLRHAGIPVDLNVVRELRNTLPKTAFVGFCLILITRGCGL